MSIQLYVIFQTTLPSLATKTTASRRPCQSSARRVEPLRHLRLLRRRAAPTSDRRRNWAARFGVTSEQHRLRGWETLFERLWTIGDSGRRRAPRACHRAAARTVEVPARQRWRRTRRTAAPLSAHHQRDQLRSAAANTGPRGHQTAAWGIT